MLCSLSSLRFQGLKDWELEVGINRNAHIMKKGAFGYVGAAVLCLLGLLVRTTPTPTGRCCWPQP